MSQQMIAEVTDCDLKSAVETRKPKSWLKSVSAFANTVGGKLIEQIRSQYDNLKEHSRLKLNVVGVASSHNAIYSRDGIDLANYKELLKASEPSDPENHPLKGEL